MVIYLLKPLYFIQKGNRYLSTKTVVKKVIFNMFGRAGYNHVKKKNFTDVSEACNGDKLQ